MGRTAATSSALAVLAACGPHAAAPAPAPAPTAPSFAVVKGDWSPVELGGPVTVPAGLGVDGDHVEYLFTGIDRAPVLATRDGTGWTQRSLATSEATAVGRFAAPASLYDEMDDTASSARIEYLRGRTRETVAERCPISASDLELLDPDTALYTCEGAPVIARRGARGWTTIATLPEIALTGAVGADGTVYVLSRVITPPARFWALRGGKLAPIAIDGVDGCWALARCGDRLYATCERSAGSALGTFDGTRWTFETVTSEYVNAGVLGFDEACHPFVAVNQDVWSRGRAGWEKSVIGGVDEIEAVLGHAGTLYAAYNLTHEDGVHAGVATAPLGYDGP